MPYTIYIIPQVTPATITVPGPMNSRRVIANPGPTVPNVVYPPPDLDIYSADDAVRKVLVRDAAGTATGVEIFAAFPKIREPKEAEIRAYGARYMSAMATPYTKEEQSTWDLQLKRALEWLADNNTPVGLVHYMAAERGITVTEMVAKIMENAVNFEPYLGYVMGYQQKLLDRVAAATDYDELQGVTW